MYLLKHTGWGILIDLHSVTLNIFINLQIIEVHNFVFSGALCNELYGTRQYFFWHTSTTLKSDVSYSGCMAMFLFSPICHKTYIRDSMSYDGYHLTVNIQFVHRHTVVYRFMFLCAGSWVSCQGELES